MSTFICLEFDAFVLLFMMFSWLALYILRCYCWHTQKAVIGHHIFFPWNLGALSYPLKPRPSSVKAHVSSAELSRQHSVHDIFSGWQSHPFGSSISCQVVFSFMYVKGCREPQTCQLSPQVRLSQHYRSWRSFLHSCTWEWCIFGIRHRLGVYHFHFLLSCSRNWRGRAS